MTESIIEIGRQCPVAGCDSSGNADGVSQFHFLPQCCLKKVKLSQDQCAKIRERMARRGDLPNNHNDNLKTHQLRSRTKLVKRQRWSPDETKHKKIEIYTEELAQELKIYNAAHLTMELEEAIALIGNKTIDYDMQYVQYTKYLIYTPICNDDEQSFRLSVLIYFCPNCLSMLNSKFVYRRHLTKCDFNKPPGAELSLIDNDQLRLFEIDGESHSLYCQNICRFAKRFLTHKTVCDNVYPFIFYVLVQKSEDNKCIVVGYFSKMKSPDQNGEHNNLSCLVVFPPFMGKGYGSLLIDISYRISKRDNIIGGPERPLTDFGLCAYRRYWTKKIFKALVLMDDWSSISIHDLSQEIFIHPNDIIETLLYHKMIKAYKGKYILLKNIELLEGFLDGRRSIEDLSFDFSIPTMNGDCNVTELTNDDNV